MEERVEEAKVKRAAQETRKSQKQNLGFLYIPDNWVGIGGREVGCQQPNSHVARRHWWSWFKFWCCPDPLGYLGQVPQPTEPVSSSVKWDHNVYHTEPVCVRLAGLGQSALRQRKLQAGLTRSRAVSGLPQTHPLTAELRMVFYI